MNKEIEEIGRIFTTTYFKDCYLVGCSKCKHKIIKNEFNYRDIGCIDYIQAEALYNAGYRKIDGINYCSIDWHNEQVLHLQEENNRLQAEIKALKSQAQDLICKAVLKGSDEKQKAIEEARKRELKELARNLLDIAKVQGDVVYSVDIVNLLKEYGIDEVEK